MSRPSILMLGFTLAATAVASPFRREKSATKQASWAPPMQLGSPYTTSRVEPDSATRDELMVAREAVWRAFFRGDSAQLVELLPDTMFAMGRHRAAIIADAQMFVRNGGRYAAISFSEDEFFVRGDVAILVSRYHVDLTQNGKNAPRSGRAIEIFEKRNGRWINPSWHLDDDRQH